MRRSGTWEQLHPVQIDVALWFLRCEICLEQICLERFWRVPTPRPYHPTATAQTWAHDGGFAGIFICRRCLPTREHVIAWRRRVYGDELDRRS